MKIRTTTTCLLILLLAFGGTALASGGTPPASEEAAQTDQSTTRLEVDEQAHVIRIVVDGTVVGLFTKDGLRVNGDITYDGLITDAGHSTAGAADAP